MTAIETRFIGPTDKRGSRVKATALGTRQTITLDWGLAHNPEENHIMAAKALAQKFGWSGQWVGGAGKDGATVFVLASTRYETGFTVDEVK